MCDTKLAWYTFNRELAIEEHPAVDLQEATEIVDRYLARGGEVFEYGEDGIAATTVGFNRSDSEFIEIHADGLSHFTYIFEAPDPNCLWLLKPWKGTFHHKEQLQSRGEVMQRLRDFFSMPASEVMSQLKRRQ
jgi:hypothetical protein